MFIQFSAQQGVQYNNEILGCFTLGWAVRVATMQQTELQKKKSIPLLDSVLQLCQNPVQCLLDIQTCVVTFIVVACWCPTYMIDICHMMMC